MGIPFGKSVRGKHTISMNGTKGMTICTTNCHLFSVCITDSNGKPNVTNKGRYGKCGLCYIGSLINVSPYMGSGIITYDKVMEKRNGIVR
jgi:hypothetical protein